MKRLHSVVAAAVAIVALLIAAPSQAHRKETVVSSNIETDRR